MDNILIEAHTKTPSIHMDNLFVSAPKQYRRVRPTPILYANEKRDATSQNVKLAVALQRNKFTNSKWCGRLATDLSPAEPQKVAAGSPSVGLQLGQLATHGTLRNGYGLLIYPVAINPIS